MIKYIFQFCISLSLLAYIYFHIDLDSLLKAIGSVDPLLYLLSSAIACSQVVVLAAKYRLLVANTNLALRLAQLVRINFIARFYALFIPSFLGPEVVRWYKITKNKANKSTFLASTILERLYFISLLVAWGYVALFADPNPNIRQLADLLSPYLLAAMALFVLMFFYLLNGFFRNKVCGFLFGLIRLKAESKVGRFFLNLTPPPLTLGNHLTLLIYSILWNILFACRVYLLVLGIGLHLDFYSVSWMACLVLLLQMVPVSLGGLGLREGAYAYLFTLYHASSVDGVLVGLLFFSQMLIICFIGWLNMFFDKPAPKAPAKG